MDERKGHDLVFRTHVIEATFKNKMEKSNGRDDGQSPVGGPPQFSLKPRSLMEECMEVFYQTLDKNNVVEKAAIVNEEKSINLNEHKNKAYGQLCVKACLYIEYNWDSQISADLKDYIQSRDDQSEDWWGENDSWHRLPTVLYIVAYIAATSRLDDREDILVFCMNHIRAELTRWQEKLGHSGYPLRQKSNVEENGAKCLKELCVDVHEVTEENVLEACEIADACTIPGLKRKALLFLLHNWNEELMAGLQEIIGKTPRIMKNLVRFSSDELWDFYEMNKFDLIAKHPEFMFVAGALEGMIGDLQALALRDGDDDGEDEPDGGQEA